MIKDYIEKSRSPWYSFIFAFPALVIYELGLFWMRNVEFTYIQNGADVLIEQIIYNSSFEVLHVSSTIFFIFAWVNAEIFFFFRDSGGLLTKEETPTIRSSFPKR